MKIQPEDKVEEDVTVKKEPQEEEALVKCSDEVTTKTSLLQYLLEQASWRLLMFLL